jgi:hypothetical protein
MLLPANLGKNFDPDEGIIITVKKCIQKQELLDLRPQYKKQINSFFLNKKQINSFSAPLSFGESAVAQNQKRRRRGLLILAAAGSVR